MTEIPDDIREAVLVALRAVGEDGALGVVASAILAERERCAQIADEHALHCASKLNKKRSDHDLAVFESACSEARSIASSIRAPSKAKHTEAAGT